MIVTCPAKLNLSFQILGRREDGYHDISSVMQTIDICDHLVVRKGDSHYCGPDSLMVTGAVVCPISDLLITKAVKVLEEAVGKVLPCSVHLDKTIPIGAGLGGGSSNAAGTLLALNVLYNLGLSGEELMALGASVSADVPFFVRAGAGGGKCLVQGIGEQVDPLPYTDCYPYPKPIYYVVFRPHRRLSTREAYETWDKTGLSFADQARASCPELEQVFYLFADAMVSGKGPSTFLRRDYWPLGEIADPFYSRPALLRMVDGSIPWNGDIFISQPCDGITLVREVDHDSR